MESLRKQATRILREQKKYKLWLTAFLCLAVLVTAGTVAALTMSGQALNRKEKVLTCQLEVHQHTEECKDSEGNLVCGQADYVVHVHNDDCYKDGELVCTLPQVEPHTHTEECFQEQKTLVCGLEENEGHVHDENCYTKVQGDLICGKEETGHQHGPECYTKVQGEPICASEEEGHEHTDECYAWTEELTCGQTEEVHEHTDECYEWKEELTCQIAEGEGAHKHTDECCEIEMVNTCGQLELHTHDESCYEEDENGVKRLVCGQTELLEHVHGEDCFVIIEPDVVEESEEASEGAEETSEALESTEGTDESAEDTDESGEPVESTEGTDESAEDTDESTEADGEEEPVQGVAGVLTAEGSDYTVTATFGEDAGIPEGAELIVREVEPGTEEYETHYQQMLEAIGGADSEASADETDADQETEEEADTQDEVEISFARLFDISFVVDGEKIEPNAGASVDIRISYQDAMECGEGETASAVHFAKDGTEILEADVVDSEEGSDFVFTQDSFSMTFSIKMIKAPNKKKTDTLTTKAGDVSVTVTGESTDSFSTSDRVVVNEIKDNGEDVESGNNRYRKYLNNSKGAIKNKVNQEGEEVEVYSARVFEISIEDSNGRKKQADNVKVAIQYNNGAKAEKSGNAAMILNSEDGGDLISSQSVAENQEIPVFTGMQTFSASAPNVVTTLLTSAASYEIKGDVGSTPTTGIVHKRVDSYLDKVNEANTNTWQIVDQEYKGQNPDDKWPKEEERTGDESVLVQKNVIPAGTENEFYVYLSIDMKEVYKKYFEAASYKATTSKGYKPEQIGQPVSEKGTMDVGVANEEQNKTLNYPYQDTFIVKDQRGNILADDIKLWWSQAENISFMMRLSNGDLILCGTGIKIGEGPHTIELNDTILEEIERELSQKVTLGTVTDIMGDNIDFDCIVAGDYKVDGTGFDEETNTLTWIPVPKEVADKDVDETSEVKTTWVRNVSELVYKVSLNVTADKSCAEHIGPNGEICFEDEHQYMVNKSAKLSYKSETGEDSKQAFPTPYVRGVLYDIDVKKVDKDDPDFGLQGAQFELYRIQEDGTETLMTNKEENTSYWTSDQNGIIHFRDLQWGTYKLVEKLPPDGYQPRQPNGEVGTVTVCYTTNQGDLEQDIPDNSSNMIYIGAGTDSAGYYKVENEKMPIKLVKVWDDEGYDADKRPDVTFQVEYWMNGDWESIPSSVEGEIGENGCVTLTSDDSTNPNQWEKIIDSKYLPASPQGYKVTEVVYKDGKYLEMAPDGYEIIKGEEYSGSAAVTEESYTETVDENPVTKWRKVYTVTNKLNRIFTIVKEDTERNRLNGVKFTLSKAEENGSFTKVGDYESKQVDGVDGIVISELPLSSGTYKLEETEPLTGYKKINPITLTVSENGAEIGAVIDVESDIAELKKTQESPESWTLTVKNKSNLLDGIQLKKVGDQGTTGSALPGASFVLSKGEGEGKQYYVQNDNSFEWAKVDVDRAYVFESVKENGEGALPELEEGTYYLTEIEAPGGYMILGESVEFKVVLEEDDSLVLEVPASSHQDSNVKQDDKTIIITNSTGFELPETGGPGTTMYTLGGLAAIATSLVYGLSMRRKKEKGGRN